MTGTTKASAVLAVLAVLATVAMAGGAAAQGASLEAMGWLVGGTWVAETPGPDGVPRRSEITYEWAAHRKLIRYRIVRRADGETVPASEGGLTWHPAKRQLVLWEVDRDGMLVDALVIPGPDGGSDIDELHYRADGSSLPVRGRLERDGDDAFVFSARIPRDGAWVEVFRARFRRARP